jgi:hypothetical protein
MRAQAIHLIQQFQLTVLQIGKTVPAAHRVFFDRGGQSGTDGLLYFNAGQLLQSPLLQGT